MVLLLLHSPSQLISSPSTISAFHTSSPPFSFSFFSHNSHQNHPFCSSVPVSKTVAFPPSAPPRKLLRRPPHSKKPLDDYYVKKVSAQEVQDLVKGERTVPLIIDFYATWCGPCVRMTRDLVILAKLHEGKVTIVKVDTEDEHEFAQDMQVRGLPTLFFISPDPNKKAIRTEGLLPFQTMLDILDEEM